MASYQVSIFSFYTEREDIREENASAGNSNISSVLFRFACGFIIGVETYVRR